MSRLLKNEALTGKRGVETNAVAQAMADIAQLKLETGINAREIFDSDIINASKWSRSKAGLGYSDVSRMIGTTFAGDMAYILNNHVSQVAFVSLDDEELGAAAAIRNEFGSANADPRTVVVAYGVRNDLEQGTMDKVLAQELAAHISSESKRFAAEATDLIGTNGMHPFQPNVCFEEIPGTYPAMEAMATRRVLTDEIMPQLRVLAEREAALGKGYSDEMERMGNVLKMANMNLPDHPLMETLVEWPQLQAAARHPMGDEYSLKRAKKTATATLIVLQSVLKALDACDEKMYPFRPSVNLRAKEPTENPSGSVLVAFEDDGKNHQGTIEFSVDDPSDVQPRITFNGMYPGTGRSTVMVAGLIEALQSSAWMKKQTR